MVYVNFPTNHFLKIYAKLEKLIIVCYNIKKS